MIPFIINAEGSTLFVQGEPVRVLKNHVNYSELLEALDEAETEEYIISLLEEAVDTQGFDVQRGEYKGEKLHPVLVQKLESLERENLPMTGMVEFCKNLTLNPSSSSVSELFDFLEYKELPITEDGCFIGYKGVSSDGYSVHGNTGTLVLQGTVNESGRIRNEVGDVIEVARNQVDDNRSIGCSKGLHVGSYDYGSTFGNRLLVVKVNPKDVVSVPTDCQCQKIRVCKYEVLSLGEAEVEDVLVGYDGEGYEGDWGAFLDAIEESIALGYNLVSDISFRLETAATNVLAGLNSLGYDFDEIDDDYKIFLGGDIEWSLT